MKTHQSIARRPKKAAKTPPPRNRTPKRAAAPESPKRQWVFSASFGDLPAALNCTVLAPTRREAWALAYLITERFSMGAIQWLKAKPESL